MRDLQRVRDGLSFDDKRLSSDDVVWPEVVGADATVFGHGKILPLVKMIHFRRTEGSEGNLKAETFSADEA